ncbi:saccharopine dehydrogenase NADP-binding domain-containing protein [Schnuerera sp. xch1]|uniref:saccharopine dehydrogenase family protein n=1 Tax=Schnuerera sp. xch1 TaxID=2874283 RepID=UPI001CBE900A|nr:saccharopine dehydrogenase C-terminal domain-containing protein [Schnuerera sp. xch1]MBZ2174416.1 saccharopine dehydrogenase NADP-binding domain-containing protein [Schnuerera sp. xch1]
MKYLVLGCGLQGRIVAYDILQFEKDSKVIIADIDDKNLQTAKSLMQNNRLSVEKFNVFNEKETVALMSKVDVIVNSLPHTWEITESFYKALAKTKDKKAVFTDYWMWEKHYKFDEALKKANVLAVPGLGIVPGFGNICVGQLAYEFDQLEEAAIYCGGLPTKRGVAPLDYMILFNVEALLDLYLTPPTVIQDGRPEVEDALDNFETFLIPGYGEVDALKTDGLYSLNKTMVEKGVKKAAEYTLRYPGHYQTMQILNDAGFFSKEPINVNGMEVIPRDASEVILNKLMKKIPGVRDFTYLYVIGKGLKDGKYVQKVYELLDYSDEDMGITSMERTTAYPASIAAIIIAHNHGGMRGVVEPENIFVGERFEKMITELAKRRVIVYAR